MSTRSPSRTDRDGRTSLPTVFAVGDGAAIGGAKVAMARARLAAAAIGHDLGLTLHADGAAADLARAERFQAALWTRSSRSRRSKPGRSRTTRSSAAARR